MILYVVDLDVDADLAEEYLLWLRAHMREMLKLPGFIDAELVKRLEPPSPEGRVNLGVRYRLRERAAFDDYLREYAPRMRAAGARFGERVRASRQLMQTLE